MGKADKSAVKTNMRAYRHIHSLNPALLPMTVVKSLLGTLPPFVNLYLSARIMNELAQNRDAGRLALLAAITIGLNLVLSVLNNFLNKLHSDAYRLFRENENLFMVNKTLDLGYADIENPDVQQLRREVYNASLHSINGYCNGIERPVNFLDLFAGTFTDLILSSVLFTRLISVLLQTGVMPVYIVFALSIAACMVLGILYNFYAAKLQSGQSMDFNTLYSYGQRIDDGLNSYNMGKDIRLYRLDKVILKIKRDYMKMAVKAKTDMEMFGFKTRIPASVIDKVLQVCSYIFVCMPAARRITGIGEVIMYVGVIQRFFWGIQNIFSHVSELKYNTRFLDNYFKFYDMPSGAAESGSNRVDLSGGYTIEFKNVSFKYPASETYALKNVSLKIKSGESLAVVGQNGSGKTTMIKLLCRLYEIDEGGIFLNGRNIKEYDYREYMNIFSILFQDFKLFSFSLGENISLCSAYEAKSAESCLEKAGFGARYAALEKGLGTYIYKNFDENGIEISGGEAQKIALARALYKNAPFIILDEPTAALDPIAEYDIYSKFNEITSDKTAVYISHRLSSCRFCDNIAVFHEGKLVQYGGHGALLSDEGGKYYELWNAQAKYYQKNP